MLDNIESPWGIIYNPLSKTNDMKKLYKQL